MGDFDGVGRVYRTELNPNIERHPHLEKTDRDKRGKDHEEHKDEEPQDKVEIHEEESGPRQPESSQKTPNSQVKPLKLDISA